MSFTRLLLASTALCIASAAHAEDWRLAKDEEGIKVYLSEVAGSPYKAYRGVTLIKTDVSKLRALQEDVVAACAWIHECKEQRLLKHEGDKSWTYTRFNTPWPVTPRDSIIEVTTEQGADGSITRKLHGVPNYQPEEKGYVRVANVEGSWTMTPKPDGMVEVIYEAHTDPGGSVPSWLSNKFVVEAPFNTLKGMREKAEH
ncbi:START domain-containing protein [Phytopseudomonas punonensis]|uniref:START domain-containing protein n=1 Tax=Phytopseudomonas punonensis TaxID=1220495 RepID=A0A1M7J8P5_9GAMM|nr:START domain-containing protein [Pseudomonas punonensis]SHM49291.1 START domain-containing protein [Pseudomonas punonensis]